ncbi:unnamed protein product [Lactuca virosa]|uniref:F-box domain-containing protein n=1 Tax=Lactuca virosa TaxID=75947 RepID=A0AAU9LNI4_9ASTR|nr:unnamed protein product [Lactuca virosa]
MNVEEDRLSSLPDDLIHKILSFLYLEQAIGVSVLSSRWKSIWKSMPYLKLINYIRINYPPDFSKFVNNVLSHRNYQVHLSSVFLYSDGRVSHEFVKRFLEYVLTHNVQQLTVSWSPENEVEFPLSFYSSRSLQHLDLHDLVDNASYSATPAWDLPALTTLHLYNITVVSHKCIDLFSKCPNLKNLKLRNCKIGETKLIATQGQGFPSLEKVDLYNCVLYSADAPNIVSLLQQLQSVKLMTLDLEILQIISSSMGLMSDKPFPFANFKIVKFLTRDFGRVYLEVQADDKYVVDSSDQSSIFIMISREEIRIMNDIVFARLLIAKIRSRLRKRKALTDTKQGRHMEQVDAPRKSCKRKMNDHGKVQVKKQKQIDGWVTELSASKRPVLQETLSVVCEEAAVVMNNMLDCMKIRCNKKPHTPALMQSS